MGVFLRWGVFGILAVAALLYAYNSSKRLAVNRPVTPTSQPAPSEEAAQSSGETLPPHCEVELRVATRALQARRAQEPLDRLLRTQDIVFEADASRRQRLESVAREWYARDGEEPTPDQLQSSVIEDCRRLSPAS